MKNDLDFTCDLCGRYFGTGDDVPSIIKMKANYGSTKYDGDRLTLQVCGSCIDWWMDSVPPNTGTWERVVPW